jgi:hypothetical protein
MFLATLKYPAKTPKPGDTLIFEQKTALPKLRHNTFCRAKTVCNTGVGFYIIRITYALLA